MGHLIAVELRCEKTMHGVMQVIQGTQSRGRFIERSCPWHSRNGARVFHRWDADTGERLPDRKGLKAA